MGTNAADIERLECQIEELTTSITQSRKLARVGQLSSFVGVLALLVISLSSAYVSVTWLIAAITLVLGGLVLAGASKSSTDELQAALSRATTDRNAAIDALELRDVPDTLKESTQRLTH